MFPSHSAAAATTTNTTTATTVTTTAATAATAAAATTTTTTTIAAATAATSSLFDLPGCVHVVQLVDIMIHGPHVFFTVGVIHEPTVKWKGLLCIVVVSCALRQRE